MLVLISHVRKNNKRIWLPSFIFMLYFYSFINLIVPTLNKEYIHTYIHTAKLLGAHLGVPVL